MPVEVVLKSKIAGLGAEADVVSVKPGYARNYLIPRDLAAPATSATKKQMEELKKKRAQREADELNAAQEFATKLGKLKLAFVLQAGQTGDKVFGSVTAQDIADKVKEAGHEIDKKKIDLPKAIKETGDHEIGIEIQPGVVAKLKINITAEKAKVVEDGDGKTARRPRPVGKKKAESAE
jgi:large subunit ribosomal protein L9